MNSHRWTCWAARARVVALLCAAGCNASSDSVALRASAPAASASSAATTSPIGAPSVGAPLASLPTPEKEPVPFTWDRYIQYATPGQDGETLALYCGYGCTTNRPAELPPMVHLWKVGERAVRTVRLPADVDMLLVSNVQLAPTGETLLAAVGSNDVAVMSGDKLLHTIHASAVYGNALLSSDEKRILSATVFGEVRLVDRTNGHVIKSAQSHNSAASVPVHIAWSASGDRAVYMSGHSAPVLLDGVSGRRIAVLNVKGASFEGHSSLAFLPQDAGLLLATTHGLVAVFDPKTGEVRRVLRAQRKDSCGDYEMTATVSPDARRVAIAGTCGDAAWIELSTGAVTELYPADGDPAGWPMWSLDGELLALVKHGTLHTVQVSSGTPPQDLVGASLVTIAEGNIIIVKTVSDELTAIKDGKELWTLPLPAPDADVTADSRRRMLYVSDGRLEIVRVRDGKNTKLELQTKDGTTNLVPLTLTAEELGVFLR